MMSVFSSKAEKVFIYVFFFIALGIPLFFYENTFYVNKVSTMLILAIFVMSLDYLVGKTGLITLGHAMFYGLGGYLFAIMVPEYEEVNFWIYTFYIMVASAVIALIVGLIVLRTSGIYMIMITLALAQMTFYFFADSTEFGGLDGLFIYIKPETSIFGLNFLDLDNEIHFYYLCLLSLLNCYVFFKITLQSRFGRVINAIKDNPERATALGYNIFHFRLIAYVLSSSLAAYAGYLFALQYGFVNPTMMAWDVSATALVMAILGGLGTVFGAILGVFVYEILHYGIEHMTQYWMFWMGSLIIIMVLALRNGIAGLIEQIAVGKRK
tara:strand:+ start:298 stop:1269 length:972 start_codon:yes stop_codon:yes gene_type:complete